MFSLFFLDSLPIYKYYNPFYFSISSSFTLAFFHDISNPLTGTKEEDKVEKYSSSSCSFNNYFKRLIRGGRTTPSHLIPLEMRMPRDYKNAKIQI